MYKFLSGILAIFLLIAVSVLIYQKWDHGKDRKRLNNQIAKIQTMQKETDTTHSRMGIEVEDLRAKNDDLNSIISDRNEKVLALTETNLHLKDKIVKFKSAKESVINPGTVTESCQEEIKDLRVRVDFDEESDPIRVSGYTITNPAYAEVEVSWVRDLKLQLVLTKNDEGLYRVYLDSENSDIVPTDLKLEVDPGILEDKWYQKIGIGADIAAGAHGAQLGLRAFYDITPNLYLGPNFVIQYDGIKGKTLYGLSVGWYPGK